jgi:hypothetical protein
MKYISIQDDDFTKVNEILNENNIEFKEQGSLNHFVEERLLVMSENDVEDIKDKVDFISNELNPLDMDLLISQALLIYESEED